MARKKKLSLQDRLESLPQEIYDEIYTLTFTPNASTFLVNNKFQAPKMTQIDASSAALYFSRCTFVGTLQNMVKWLQHIEHTPPVSSSTMRCYIKEDADDGWPAYADEKDKTDWMILQVERVEEEFGEDCCLDLPIFWSRQAALQGLKLS